MRSYYRYFKNSSNFEIAQMELQWKRKLLTELINYFLDKNTAARPNRKCLCIRHTKHHLYKVDVNEHPFMAYEPNKASRAQQSWCHFSPVSSYFFKFIPQF